MKYDIYKNYSVLPGFYKFGHDFGNGEFDKQTFQFDEELEYFLDEKKKIIHEPYHVFNQEENILHDVENFIQKETGLKGNFCELGKQIQEDIVIHKVTDDADWLSCCHVSFPSGWEPEKQIGKTFAEIHSPVPNFKWNGNLLKASTSGKFVRFVWSIVYQNSLNFHPNVTFKEFDIKNPEFYVKVERQVVVGFPEHSAFLFVIRQNILKDINKHILLSTIENMNNEYRQYKGITDEFIGWLNYDVYRI